MPCYYVCFLVGSSCQARRHDVGLACSSVYFRNGNVVSKHQNTCRSWRDIFPGLNMLCIGVEYFWEEGFCQPTVSRGATHSVVGISTTVVGVYLKNWYRWRTSISICWPVFLISSTYVYIRRKRNICSLHRTMCYMFPIMPSVPVVLTKQDLLQDSVLVWSDGGFRGIYLWQSSLSV